MGKVFVSAATLAAAGLLAQETQAKLRPYGVAEAGIGRRQVLPDGQVTSDPATRQRDSGFAYGGALGVEAPLSSTLFAAIEAGVTKSTEDTDVTTFRGVELVPSVLVGVFDRTVTHPRLGYSLTGRLGITVFKSAAVYALAGAGGERVRVVTSTGINLAPGSGDNAVELSTQRHGWGAVFGGGARVALSDHVGARVEYRRLETDHGYDPEQVMAGLTFRR